MDGNVSVRLDGDLRRNRLGLQRPPRINDGAGYVPAVGSLLVVFNRGGAGARTLHHSRTRAGSAVDGGGCCINYGLVKILFDGRLRSLRLGILRRHLRPVGRRSVDASEAE